MYLTKLLMRDFGKFHNAELNLTQGINVVSGGESSGKTTVARFISSILYGVRKNPQDKEKGGEYESLRPTKSSGFSGTGYCRKDGKSYLIDRTFLAGSAKASVLDIASGREVTLKEQGTLVGTLVDMDKNTYADTYIISEQNSDESEDVGGEISTYLMNKLETGNGSIDKKKAIAYLEKEKAKNDPRPLIRRLDNLNEQIEAYDDVDTGLAANKKAMRQLTEDFAIEAERRKRVSRQMVENEDGTVTYQADEELDEKIDRLTEAEKTFGAMEKAEDKEADEKSDNDEEEEEGGKKKKKLTDNIFIILLTGAFDIAAIALLVRLIGLESAVQKLFIVFTGILVVMTMLLGFRDKGYFSSDEEQPPSEEEFNRVLQELEEEKNSREELEFDMTFAKEFQEKKEQLKEEEKTLLERKQKRDKLMKEQSQVFKKKSELEAEVSAIQLAITTIEALSRKYQEQAAKTFLPHLSEYVAPLTGNEYAAIVFDQKDGLSVEGYTGRMPIARLPEETARRVYLAMRLSMAKYAEGEQLPLVIDDVAEFETVEEASIFVQVLRDMSREQIVVLTKDGTSEACLRKAMEMMQVTANYVALG